MLKKFSKSLENKVIRVVVVGILLVIVQLVFSGYSVISVLYVKNKYDPWLVILFRVLIAIPTNVLMSLWVEGKFSLWINDSKYLLFFMFFGIANIAINALMYLHVVILINASYAAILNQLVPIFSAIFSMMFHFEPLPSFSNKSSMLRLFGIIFGVSFATTICILSFKYGTEKIPTKNWIIGTLLGFFKSMITALYYVTQTKVFYNKSNNPFCKKPFTLTCMCTIYGGTCYVIMFIAYFFGKGSTLYIDKYITIPVFYSGILNITVGFGLLNFCVKHSSAMVSSCMFSMNIATSLIFLRLFANEKLLISQYILCVPLIGCGFMVILSPLLKSTSSNVNKIDI